MSSVGRPLHAVWRDNFTRIEDPKSDKKVALCKICKKTISNTSKGRLQAHRKVCPRRFLHAEGESAAKRIKHSSSSSARRARRPFADFDEEVDPFSTMKIETVETIGLQHASNGRQLHSMWRDSFVRVKHPETQKVVALCQICEKIIMNTAINRLKAHRKTCPNGQKNRSQQLSYSDDEESQIPKFFIQQSASTSDWLASDSREDRQSTYSKSDDRLDSSVSRPARLKSDTLSPNEKQNLDELYGMYVYSCSDPLKSAESSHLRKFIKALRPNYEIPSTEDLKTTIKDHCKKQFLLSLSVASNLFDENLSVKEVLSTFEKKLEND